MFHGGIHFDAGTGSELKQGDGVKVIADGEVVAYRLDSAYPELTYPTTPPRYALYSTGFVLVRHRLVLPPEPKPANSPAGASGTQAPRSDQPPLDDVLEFYSLYMHQLDWAGYETAEQAEPASSIHRMPFWEGDRFFRVTGKANDKLLAPSAGSTDASQDAGTWQTGIRICDRASGSVIGLLPRGGELTVVGNAVNGWAQIATITKGAPVTAIAGGSAHPSAATGWVNLDELDGLIDPKPLDMVVVLNTPFKVQAGDVVGYLGEYQNSTQSSMLPPKPMRPLLHVEVFTAERISDFIQKSRERAIKLGNKIPGGKTLLVIQQGTKLVKPSDSQSNAQLAGLTLVRAKDDPGKGAWAKVQPTKLPAHGHFHDPSGKIIGNPLWVERKYVGKVAAATLQTWTAFPLQLANAQEPPVDYQQVLSRAELEQFPDASRAAEENKGHGPPTQWWSINAGVVDGGAIFGWVCEKDHPEALWQSPWAWPDFDTVDTTGISVIDMYRRNLFETKQLLDGEEKEFGAIATKTNASPFFAKLEKAITRKAGGVGNMVPSDLKKALTVPWLAQVVSHLIVNYESEWGGDMSKWEALSSLMSVEGKPVWQTELERIEKLKWWDKVSAVKGFPASPDVWHIHPIGLVGNFSSEPPLITLQMLAAVDPTGDKTYHQQILPALNKYANGYQVNTPRRIAHFLSQIVVESGFRNVEEQLSYSAKRMKQIFGCKSAPRGKHQRAYTETAEDIVCNFGKLRDKLWTQTTQYERNPKKLGSYVYAGRYGNGDENTGDGYKYRGRGLIQTTFKSNYQVLTDEHNRRFPDDHRDFVTDPDLVLRDLEYGVESAFVYWAITRSVNAVADAGDVRAVTHAVNGGENGYADRKSAYNNVAPILGVATEGA